MKLFNREEKHDDEPIAVSYSGGIPFSPSLITYVLWRCNCHGRVASQTLAGRWTMAEIRGEGRIKIQNKMSGLEATQAIYDEAQRLDPGKLDLVGKHNDGSL